MATELAAAYITLMPSLKGAQSSITKQLSGLDLGGADKALGAKMAGAISDGFSKAGKTMVKFGKVGTKAILGIGAAITGISAQGGFSRAMNFERANMIFKGLKMSEEDIAKATEAANASVKGTAFGLDEAAKAAAMLAASGVPLDDMQKHLQAIAGTASMAGTGMDDITDIFQRVAANGKLSGEELARLSDRGVAARQLLAEQLHVTGEELSELVKGGEIDFKTFADAMYNAFGDAAYGANETFTGALANTRAALARVGQGFAQTFMDSTRTVLAKAMPFIDAIKGKLGPLYDAVERFGSVTSGMAADALEKFTGYLENGDSPFVHMIQRLADSIETFTSYIEAGHGPLESFAAAFGKLVQYTPVGVFLDKVVDALSRMGEKLSALAQSSGIVAFFTAFGNAVYKVVNSVTHGVQPIQAIGDAIDSAFGTNVSSQVQAVLTFIVQNIGKLAVVGATAAIAITKFGAISGALTGVVGAVRGAFTVIGGAFGGITSTLSLFHASIGQILVSGGKLGSFFAGMPKYLLGMINPVGAVVAVIAALVAGFVYLMATNEEFRATVMGLIAQIGEGLAPILDAVSQSIAILAATVIPAVTSVIDSLLPVIAKVIEIILQVFATLAPIISAILGIVLPAAAAIIGAVANIISFIVGVLSPVITAILDLVSSILSGIQGVVQSVMAAINGDWSGAWSLFDGAIRSVLDGVKGFADTVFSWFLDAVGGLGDVIGGFVDIVGGALDGIIGFGSQLFGGMSESVDSAAPQLEASTKSATEGAIAAANSVAGTAEVGKQLSTTSAQTVDTSAMVQPAEDMVSKAIDAAGAVDASGVGKAFSTSAASGIDTSAMSSAISAVSSAAGALNQTATIKVQADLTGVNALRAAVSTVTGAYNSLSGTIASAMSRASGAAVGAANSIRSAINSIPTRKSITVTVSKSHIPTPHWSISGSFSLNPPRVPIVSTWWAGKGGIFTQPALIGVGDAKEPEGVFPLSRLESLLEAGSGRAGDGITINLNYNAGTDAVLLVNDIQRELKRRRLLEA